MCLPLAAIGAIAGVASAGAGYIGQRQQAKAQAAYQAQSAAAERQRAVTRAVLNQYATSSTARSYC